MGTIRGVSIITKSYHIVMYSTPHAMAGLVINVTSQVLIKDSLTAYLVAIPFAIFSHWCLDFLFEAGLGKQILAFDIIPSWVYYIIGWLSGDLLLYFISWVEGNLLDIIDKKLYLSVINQDKYQPTFYFHKQKNGIIFTLNQTKLASVVSLIVVGLIGIFY